MSSITDRPLLIDVADTGGQVFNVKAFGARGDGLTDDTAAIQAAITAAASAATSPPYGRATVYVPHGYYVVSSPVTISASYMSLVGAGKLSSVLMLPAGVPDVTAVLIVGSSQTVSSVRVECLGIEAGADKGHSTGHGIVADTGDLFLRSVYVSNAPQDAIRSVPTTSSTQNKALDVYINNPGRDGLVIGANNHDTDWISVISKMGSSSAAKGGRYGIYNQGVETHLLACHPFFAATDGLRSDQGSVQVIGGEYETNAVNGINLLTQTSDYSITGVTGFYANGGTDISIGSISSPNKGTITNCTFRSGSISRNVIISSQDVTIQGCTFRNFTSEGVLVNGAARVSVMGCIFDGASAATRSFATSGTNGAFLGNQFMSQPARELTNAANNNFTGNSLNGTGQPVLLGANGSVNSNNV